MEAVHTSETSVDNHFTQQYNPEDSSEHQSRLNLLSHLNMFISIFLYGIHMPMVCKPLVCMSVLLVQLQTSILYTVTDRCQRDLE
jgi:hypothetical protein